MIYALSVSDSTTKTCIRSTYSIISKPIISDSIKIHSFEDNQQIEQCIFKYCRHRPDLIDGVQRHCFVSIVVNIQLVFIFLM